MQQAPPCNDCDLQDALWCAVPVCHEARTGVMLALGLSADIRVPQPNLLLHTSHTQQHPSQGLAGNLRGRCRPPAQRQGVQGSSQAGAPTWNVAQKGGVVLGGFRQLAVVLYACSMVCVWVPSMLPPSPIRMCAGAQGCRAYMYTQLDLCGRAWQA